MSIFTFQSLVDCSGISRETQQGAAGRWRPVIPAASPHSHGPALPGAAHTVHASNTKSSKHKSLQLIRVHALTGQAHAVAVSGAQGFWGLPWGSPKQTRASLAMLSCGGPQPIFLRSLRVMVSAAALPALFPTRPVLMASQCPPTCPD